VVIIKNIYFIGGPMGVGKTAVSKELTERLNNCVFLDGDWCWASKPFIVNGETRTIVIDNICYLLNNFINSDSYDNIVFCWVMHKQSIIDDILSKLNLNNCIIHNISLIATQNELCNRLNIDINNGIRDNDIIERSIEYLNCYSDLNTKKIDTTNKSIKEIVDAILN